MKIKIGTSFNLFTAIVALVTGILLIVNPSFLIGTVFVICGLAIILLSIPAIIYASSGLNDSQTILSFIVAILNIALGTIMIFWHNVILTIIIGVWLIAFPLYKIIVSSNKKQTFKSELIRLILGGIVLIAGPTKSLSFLAYIIGGLFIAYALFTIIMFIIVSTKNNKQKKNDEAIDA